MLDQILDKAFKPFNEIIAAYTDVGMDVVSDDGNIRTFVYRLEVDSPLELDVVTDSTGNLIIGITPPIYDLRTSFSSFISPDQVPCRIKSF